VVPVGGVPIGEASSVRQFRAAVILPLNVRWSVPGTYLVLPYAYIDTQARAFILRESQVRFRLQASRKIEAPGPNRKRLNFDYSIFAVFSFSRTSGAD
jgi:hypothetical protein